MSLLDSNVFDGRSSDFDLLETNYYKLPFCDDDLEGFSEIPSHNWNQIQHQYTNDIASYDIQYNDGQASPISPSYSPSASAVSVTSSSKNNTHSLLNERPDTPLLAVKFEDFSNDYGLNEFGYPSVHETKEDEGMIIDDEMMNIDGLDFSVMSNQGEMKSENGFACASCSGTLDCCFGLPNSKENTITISKAKDGSAVIKTPSMQLNEPVDFSFTKKQPILTSPTPMPTSNSNVCAINKTSLPVPINSEKPSQLVICDPVLLKQIPTSKVVMSPVTLVGSNPTLEELIDISDLITLPSTQKIKIAPSGSTSNGKAVNTFTHKTQIQIPTSALHKILKNGQLVTKLHQEGQILSKIKICTADNNVSDNSHFITVNNPQLDLPPTPPSSTNSDTEGSGSPGSHALCASPTSIHRSHIRVQPATSSTQLAAQLLSSTQRFAQSHGPLVLTEEEKRTLVAEGYSVPSKLPLTKGEEKSLKKIRRKIKNKISAQESRRKKKEYVETLEKQMDVYNKENGDLKRKLDSLESSNRSLLSQLRSLQTLVAGKIPKPTRTVTTQTSSCLMMVVLCFAMFLGGWYPFLSPNMNQLDFYNNAPSNSIWRSRIVHGGQLDMCNMDDKFCHPISTIENSPDNTIEVDTLAAEINLDLETSETYDEPTGGRVTMNDTEEQTSNIIANTMEPRTAADVLASRKLVVHTSSKLEIIASSESVHDVAKKSAQLIKE